MSTVLYDAAVLVAADRNERRAWAQHKARLEFGILPLVPAPVVAQVSRSSQQVQLRRFLAGCEVVPLGESEAHEAGRLLGITRTADVVDAVVVTIAIRRKAMILTSDADDINRLVSASGREIAVVTEGGLQPATGASAPAWTSVAHAFSVQRRTSVRRRPFRKTKLSPEAVTAAPYNTLCKELSGRCASDETVRNQGQSGFALTSIITTLGSKIV